jgi:SAM-dependent methyltransferase
MASCLPIIELDVCQVCGGRRLAELPVPGRWVDGDAFADVAAELGLRSCRDCGFVFVNPRPSPALLDRFYQSHDAATYDPGNGAATIKGRGQLALIGRFTTLPAAPRILDYGCGVGHLLACARERGWDAFGYDVSAAAVAACRGRKLAATDQIDEVRSRRFDVVTMSHVFEHVTDPGAVLDVCASVLEPGGAVFIEVPNVRSLRALLSSSFARRRLGFDERYRAFPAHLSYFAPATLERLLAGHGLVVRGLTTVGAGTLRPGCGDDHGPGASDPHQEVGHQRRTGPRWHAKALARRVLHDRRLGENLVVVATTLAASGPIATQKRQRGGV